MPWPSSARTDATTCAARSEAGLSRRPRRPASPGEVWESTQWAATASRATSWCFRTGLVFGRVEPDRGAGVGRRRRRTGHGSTGIEGERPPHAASRRPTTPPASGSGSMPSRTCVCVGRARRGPGNDPARPARRRSEGHGAAGAEEASPRCGSRAPRGGDPVAATWAVTAIEVSRPESLRRGGPRPRARRRAGRAAPAARACGRVRWPCGRGRPRPGRSVRQAAYTLTTGRATARSSGPRRTSPSIVARTWPTDRLWGRDRSRAAADGDPDRRHPQHRPEMQGQPAPRGWSRAVAFTSSASGICDRPDTARPSSGPSRSARYPGR